MSVAEAARLIGKLTTAPPTLAQHDELVRLAMVRDRKADKRVEAARREKADAAAGIARAEADRLAFIEANPDPQMVML
jgi:hypothetical protein